MLMFRWLYPIARNERLGLHRTKAGHLVHTDSLPARRRFFSVGIDKIFVLVI